MIFLRKELTAATIRNCVLCDENSETFVFFAEKGKKPKNTTLLTPKKRNEKSFLNLLQASKEQTNFKNQNNATARSIYLLNTQAQE